MNTSTTQTQAGLSRRALLTICASVSALAGTGLLVRQQLNVDYPPSAWPGLDAQTAAIFRRLAQRFLPAASPDFPAFDSLPMMDGLARDLSQLPAALSDQLIMGLKAFNAAALVYGWHAEVFVALSDQDADRYLERWARGLPPQRALVMASRQLLCLHYWRHASTWPATGYAGPLHLRSAIPALGDAAEPLRLHTETSA